MDDDGRLLSAACCLEWKLEAIGERSDWGWRLGSYRGVNLELFERTEGGATTLYVPYRIPYLSTLGR